MSTFTLQELIDDIEKAEERHTHAPVADEDFVDRPHDVLLTVCTSCHRAAMAALAAALAAAERRGMERALRCGICGEECSIVCGNDDCVAAQPSPAEPAHAEPKEGG